jgi:hypothetical protein
MTASAHIVKARTVLGLYGADMRGLRRLMRALDEEQRRVLELMKFGLSSRHRVSPILPTDE